MDESFQLVRVSLRAAVVKLHLLPNCVFFGEEFVSSCLGILLTIRGSMKIYLRHWVVGAEWLVVGIEWLERRRSVCMRVVHFQNQNNLILLIYYTYEKI